MLAVMILGAVTLASLADPVASPSGQAQRPWSVRDSLGVRYFDDDAVASHDDGHVVPAPDGRRFFFVTRRGDLACDCVKYELEVFEVSAVLAALASEQATPLPPSHTVTMSSASSDSLFHRGIANARWTDNRTITFEGVEGSAHRRFYSINAETGRLLPSSPVCDCELEVGSTKGDSTIAWLSSHDDSNWRDPLDTYPSLWITGNQLSSQVYGLKKTPYTFTLVASYHGARAKRVISFLQTEEATSYPLSALSIAADGNWAVLAFRPESKGQDFKYEILNLSSAKIERVIDMGSSSHEVEGIVSPNVLWSPDNRHVVLVDAISPSGTATGKDARGIVEYDVKSGTLSTIATLHPPATLPLGADRWFASSGWVKPGEQLLVKYTALAGPSSAHIPMGGDLYKRQAEQWSASDADPSIDFASAGQNAPALVGGLKVALHQSANDAPTMIASLGSRQRKLTSPDPALDGVWIAPMREVAWTDPDGKLAVGGLLLPRDYSPSSPPPLVIQAYHYEPELFTPDGAFSTGYAAQALVARGMAVLFMVIPIEDRQLEVGSTPKEGPYFVARLDAAVKALAAQNFIDPLRVGLVGFSRAGFNTYYAITHPGEIHLAAAEDAQGWTASYGEYVEYAATGSVAGAQSEIPEFDSINGGSFWSHREAWLENAPGFNVGRVTTPFLFQSALLPTNTVFTLEITAAFRLAKKPFEFLMIPSGYHELHRPREREASMAATVDWMDFWLLGHEDPDNGKTEQYARWRAMKADWKRQQAGEAAAAAK